MQKLTIILLLLFSSLGELCAQRMDSLVIKLEGNSHLLIVIENLEQLSSIQNINDLVAKLDEDLRRLQEDIQSEQPSKVRYQLNEDNIRTIKIEQSGNKVIAAYSSAEEIIKGKSAPDSIFIPLTEFNEWGAIASRKKLIFVVDYLEDVARIAPLDIDKRLAELAEKYKKNPAGRGFISSYAKYEYPLASGAEGEYHYRGEPDYLSLSSTGGLSFIRGKWAPDLGFRVRANFYSRDKLTRLIIGAGMNWYGFFEETEAGYQTNINTFVSVYGRLLLGDGNPDALSFGLGVGYLTKGRGEYFGKNTFKVFAPITIGKTNLNLTPELYITDQFKTVFPAFRIGVGF